jgi:hypothetical protein
MSKMDEVAASKSDAQPEYAQIIHGSRLHS